MIFDSYMQSLDDQIEGEEELTEEFDYQISPEQPEMGMPDGSAEELAPVEDPEPQQVNSELKDMLKQRLLGERLKHRQRSTEFQKRALELKKGMF